ncbi:quinone-dependent dihydroorotate dehydrogenase [soil metagenome]
MIFAATRPLLFKLDPERAHRLTIRALRLLPSAIPHFDPRLSVTVAGLNFPSPVGLAAGFDKDAEVPDAMLRLGFGSVEIGTVTPLAQNGNPQPRLFRLAMDEAVINRMGFNNRGQIAAHARLASRKKTGIVGVNIGANKDTVDRISDYSNGVRRMADVADYLTINISSPNTPGLRALQDAGALSELLAAIRDARLPEGPPVFLKVAPDLEPVDIDDISRAAIEYGVDALIVANTTISRPPMKSYDAGESGGLSGAPLKQLALNRLRDFRVSSGGQIPLIAAGGIASADDAYARIRAGAALVQLYSALVYHGPSLARSITKGLIARLDADGFACLSDAIGADAQ